MQPISVVIIAKNEAHLLAQTLQSVKPLCDDIVVCDTGSSDATIPIALKNGAVVIEEDWRGYGLTKNMANERAVYDWILQLDADEIVDEELLQCLLTLDLKDEKQVFTVQRKNFYKDKHIRFGEWGKDEPFRLFNRNQAAWNADPVHEKLIFETDTVVRKLKGSILHKTLQSTEQYKQKIKTYAVKSGEKYFYQKKKGAWIKKHLAPVFSFTNNYLFKLGFLDGLEGLQLASIHAGYTRIKYETLYNLQHTKQKT